MKLKAKAKYFDFKSQNFISGIVELTENYLKFQSSDFYNNLKLLLPIKNIVQTGFRRKLFIPYFFYVKDREGKPYKFYTLKSRKLYKALTKLIY